MGAAQVVAKVADSRLLTKVRRTTRARGAIRDLREREREKRGIFFIRP
jgi:hypothetical protein